MSVLQLGVIANQVLLLALYLFVPVILSHLPSEPVLGYQLDLSADVHGWSLVRVLSSQQSASG